MAKLKYDFINEDHKRMHDALIAAGWTCENDKRVKDSFTVYEWVYTYVDTSIIYFCKGFNTVFYTSSKPTCAMFYCKTFVEIADYFDITMKDKQPTFNVGDKVEILSDATYEDGASVVGVAGCKSAIGKIGIIEEYSGVSGRYKVTGLGHDCGDYWWYKPDQLRKVEDNENNKETKMEKRQLEDFSHIKVGQWVKCIDKTIDYCNMWLQRVPCPEKHNLGKSTKYRVWFYIPHKNDAYYNWDIEQFDLTDIRDTNPDEEIKMQEDQEHYPITKDNIVEVLNYNKSLGLKINHINKTDDYICYRQLINGKWENVRWGFAFNWLDHIELDLGKLKPLPKPKFDFEEYINQHITEQRAGKLARMWLRVRNGQKPLFETTKENADILIEMAKLAEELS